MAFTDFLKNRENSQQMHSEAKRAAKYLCIDSGHFLLPATANFLACDINALIYYISTDTRDTATANIYDKMHDALQAIGYPYYNSLRYCIARKNNRLDEAKKYLNIAVTNNEPVADYLNAYHLLCQDKKNRYALKEIDRIATTTSHPCQHMAKILKSELESHGKASEANTSSKGMKVIKIFVKLALIWGVINSILSGSASDMFLFLGIYAVLKVISLFCKGINSIASEPLINQEKYYDITTLAFKHSLDIFNSNIIFPEALKSSGGYYRLPSRDKNAAFLDNLKYEKIIFDDNGNITDIEESAVFLGHSESVEQGYTEIITNILGQVSILRKQKKPILMEACQNGDEVAKAALLMFFGTEYINGEFRQTYKVCYSDFIDPELAYFID